MPCDGKNPNCDRRRELLTQLKCLISSMDRKKPCEWDEPLCPPLVCRAEMPCVSPLYVPSYCRLVKPCKSFDFRTSIMYRCECIKRNGLQDRCMMWDCMGRPECVTKLYPICEPGRAALLRLTDLDDEDVVLRKFYCADRAREAALAAYCRLACDKTRQKQALSCNRNNSPNIETLCTPSMPTPRINVSNDNNYNLDNVNNSWCKPILCGDLPASYQICVPSQACPSYTLQSCGVCCPLLS